MWICGMYRIDIVTRDDIVFETYKINIGKNINEKEVNKQKNKIYIQYTQYKA